MRFNKKIVVFSIILILMLSLSAVVRAAPPPGRSIAGDHLDLNALEKAGQSDSLAGQEEPSDGTENDGDTGDDTDEDDTDGDADDGDTDGDADDGDTGDDADDIVKEHPVAASIAEYFEVEYDEIKNLHDEGSGFGNLARAFFLAQMMDGEGDLLMKATAILEQAKQEGWGKVKKEYAGHAGGIGSVGSIRGKGHQPAAEPTPPPDEPDPGADDPGDSIGSTEFSQSSVNGNGHGNGQGKEQNNGKAKGKGKK